jgi:hypothetical protein
VGTLGGLPFAYRIVPLRVGTARLGTCTAIGGGVSYDAASISMNGIAEEPGRSLSEAEARETCKWSEHTSGRRVTWISVAPEARAPGRGAPGLGRSPSRRRSGQ